MQKKKVAVLIVCLVISYAVAFIGSLFMVPGVQSEWYASVNPSITPPNYIFNIIEIVIFFFIACSLYFAWISAKTSLDKKRVVTVYTINFVAGIFWSILYFTLHQPLWAFADLVMLASSIISIMLATWDDDLRVSWLLTPYFAWIVYLGVLNWMFVLS
ncbi:MAG: TspO/MBR family protein [Nanoarchaeota archaeon]